jgi:hypothetical protein
MIQGELQGGHRIYATLTARTGSRSAPPGRAPGASHDALACTPLARAPTRLSAGRGGHHAYIDGLARRTAVLVLLVFGGSLLDAGLTLLHLEDGGSEANPVLALALTGLSMPCLAQQAIPAVGSSLRYVPGVDRLFAGLPTPA